MSGESQPLPDISQITDYLYISAWPRGEHAGEIRALGVRLILSVHWRRPVKTIGHAPVRLLWLPTVDTPLTPMPIFVLRRGVEAALPVIQQGGKVLVHCKAGVHRSVPMACRVDRCRVHGRGGDAAGEGQACRRRPRRVVHPAPYSEIRTAVALGDCCRTDASSRPSF